ncbi:MAG TPA: hypothetical protein P5076_11015, partial [Myxococcota bacterium]|nr:hypothetical protein [Myxococcota bacterium]
MQSEAGTLLVQSGLITEAQLRQALTAALQSGCSLIQALVRLGLVPPDELSMRLSSLLEIPLAEAAQFDSLPAFITRLVTAEVVMTHRVIPIMLHRGVLHLAMSDPTNRAALEEISFLTGYSVRPVAASEPLIEAAMAHLYGIPPDGAIPEMGLLPGLPAQVPQAPVPPPEPAPPPARPAPETQAEAAFRPRTDPEIRWVPPAAAVDGELEELFWGAKADQEVIHLTRLKRASGLEQDAAAPRNLGEALQNEVLRALE